MKAKEIMEELFALSVRGDFTKTCDTCKGGNPEAEVKKVAFSMFGTPEVYRKAAEWGADLLIVHEPSFYKHFDERVDEAQENEKRALIEKLGLTVYRYHDHIHTTQIDHITLGMLEAIDLPGKADHETRLGLTRFVADKPFTPRELAIRFEENLGIKHVRVCGSMDKPCTKIDYMFGTPGHVLEVLQGDSEVVVTGEICEWSEGEYARDAGELGKTKALIVLGHIGSERDGMKYAAKLFSTKHPEIPTQYFECGEVYNYAR